MTPIVTQVLVKKKMQRPLRREWIKTPPTNDDPQLYGKEFVSFLIFGAVVFMVLMIALYA
jgi:hypothetical protein